MGLISYIKGVYYDHRIEKADQLLRSGNVKEAEEIYKELLGKQYDAVCKLANLYHSQCAKAIASNDTNKEVSLLKNLLGLRTKGGDNYDISAYNFTIGKTVNDLIAHANSLFAKVDYQKCCDLTSAINATAYKTAESTNLACEAGIMLLLIKLKVTKHSSTEFKSVADKLITEFNSLGKTINRCEQAVESFCQELISSKRFLSANYLLERLNNKPHKESCLSNAVCIVDGKDTEASANDIKGIVSKYGKEMVLKASQASEESIRLFNQCWKQTSSDSFVMDIIIANKANSLQNEIIKNILTKHTSFLSKDSLRTLFVDWVQNLSDNKECLSLLEKIHLLGYDVKNEYLKTFKGFISPLKTDDKIPHINHALSLFRKDSTLLSIKLDCARWYASHQKNDEAIAIVDEIGGTVIGADLVKAEAIFNKAKTQPIPDRRIELLNDALKAITAASRTKGASLIDSINGLFIDTAELYYTAHETEKSYEILHKQAESGSNRAIMLIIEHRYQEITETGQNDKQTKIEEAISEIKAFNNATIYNVPSYQKIWEELSAVVLSNAKKLANPESIKQLESFISRIEQENFSKDCTKQIKSGALKLLIQRKYLVARENEIAKDYAKASETYREISILEAKKSPTLSALRFVLCRLKDYQNSNILNHKENVYSILRQASDTFNSEKKDIAYRFALVLLKSGEIDESLAVLSEFLPEETHLKKACEQGYIEKALAKLDEFNLKLELIKTRQLSSDDAIYFINHMLEYAEAIKPVLEVSRPVLGKYRNKIKNYAISKLFDEGKYSIAFEKLKKVHADYLDDLTDLRNIAIVCLNMAESGQLSNSNYKEVISVWLTAIYQEKLFVKSLDYTSWDDNFTFSLYDAFGHFNEDTVGDLPDNVNFDDSGDDKLVMIKEVQRSLLDRFEAAISENQEYHIFFTGQKDSMDAFIALNMDVKCKIVAPYLASSSEDIFEEITDALEHEREEEYDNWEDVLAVGADYGLHNSIYTDFITAKNCYENCIQALDSKSITDTRGAFTQSRLDLIRRFNKKYKALLSYASSKVSSLSADNLSEFKKGFGQFSIVCNGFKDSTLSYSFSNFVMRFVVDEVNEKRLSKEDAAEYILTAHLLDKTNARVSDNLGTLLSLLMQEYVQEGKSTTLTSIKNILSKTRSCDASLDNDLVDQLAVIALLSGNESRMATLSSNISTCSSRVSTFAQKINTKVIEAKVNKELNEIVDKVNNNSMNKSTALTKVYDIYSKYPNNSRVCENLATLCDMCIMEYIVGQAYGSSSVRTTLNKLKNNMSSEFKKHNAPIRKTYNTIWNQLDSNTKMLLKGLGAYNQTLNDKGRALQEGLEYMKTLGCVTTGLGLFDF